MLPSLHCLPATGVKRPRINEEVEDSEMEEMPVDHPKVVGNKLAINLQRGINARYRLGQDGYNKKCNRLTTVGIAPDSVSGMADERLLMVSLEDAELTPEAYSKWLAFLHALSEHEQTGKQDMALIALRHLKKNVDVWLDEARVNHIRELVLRHPRYAETLHGHDANLYKQQMERDRLFKRLKIHIGDARWGDALALLYVAKEVRSVDMGMNLYAMGHTTLKEGYRTYEEILVHVQALAEEEAMREFKNAAQAATSM